MRCERVLRLALALASDLLEAPLPPPVAAFVRQDPGVLPLADHVRRGLFLPPRAGAGTFRFHLGGRESWRAKLHLTFGSLTALNQRDLQVVDLPDAALPLYYMIRPARLLAKAVVQAVRGPHG